MERNTKRWEDDEQKTSDKREQDTGMKMSQMWREEEKKHSEKWEDGKIHEDATSTLLICKTCGFFIFNIYYINLANVLWLWGY